MFLLYDFFLSLIDFLVGFFSFCMGQKVKLWPSSVEKTEHLDVIVACLPNENWQI